MKLDYTLKTAEERKKIVEQILAETEEINSKYLEILADYLVVPIEREERRQRRMLTENRLATINKRETSLEGMENIVYNLENENTSSLLQPKISISQKDLLEIPFLAQLRNSIERWEAKLKKAEGRDAFIIKRTLIEMRRDQYVIKNAYKKPIAATKLTKSKPHLKLEEECRKNEQGELEFSGFSLCNPKICQIILCNYSRLKQDAQGDFEGDVYFLMEDFDKEAEAALAEYPIYQKIVECKVDGMSNANIQLELIKAFNKKHSVEYISNLWRNKIPQLIAAQAEADFLDWYFLVVEKGKYKKCSRCGQIKLANNKNFSKNKTSKDGWYSICKHCRSKKGKEAK